MIASALAVAAALLGIASAVLFALRARYFERVLEATEDALRHISRRCRAAEATAREWSERCARAERELAEADRAIVQLSNERDTLSAGYDLLRARLDARDLTGRSEEVAS